MAEEKKIGEKNESVEKETDKTKIKEKPKKTEKSAKETAVVNAYSLRISPKQSFAICKVLKGKRSIPMASREVAHQKGRGIAGAKFPKNACKEIINVLKQVKANAVVAGIENPIVTIARANRASAPFRSGGRKGKRTHLHLEVRNRLKL